MNPHIESILLIESEIKSLQARLAEEKGALLSSLDNQIKSQIGDKDYGCGTATIDDEGYRIKVVVPKRVKWDNNRLETIAQEISMNGGDPKDSIKVKYEVSETLFKSWGEDKQKYFSEAREVSQGTPTIKIEETK